LNSLEQPEEYVEQMALLLKLNNWDWIQKGKEVDFTSDYDWNLLFSLTNYTLSSIDKSPLKEEAVLKDFLKYFSDYSEQIYTSISLEKLSFSKNEFNGEDFIKLFDAAITQFLATPEKNQIPEIVSKLDEVFEMNGAITYETHKELVISWAFVDHKNIEKIKMDSVLYLETMVELKDLFKELLAPSETMSSLLESDPEGKLVFLDRMTWAAIYGGTVVDASATLDDVTVDTKLIKDLMIV